MQFLSSSRLKIVFFALVVVTICTTFGYIGHATFAHASLLSGTQSSYPQLSASYTGSVHNIPYNITSNFALSSITEDQQGNISGQMIVDPPLYGSGPFTGTVSVNNTINFTVTSTPGNPCGCTSVIFTGTVKPQNTLSGNYTANSQTGPQTGTWQVSGTSTPMPTPCTVAAGKVGTTQCNSKCTLDYCVPANWNTLAVGGLTPGVEPLNVIISARSTVPLGKILTALNNWSEVSTGSPPSGCLSPEEANVTGSNAIQEQSWRLDGCLGGNGLSLFGMENHARLWHQSVPGSEFVAWFISASYETTCVSLHGKLKPLRSLNGTLPIGNPWHCIDGGPGSYFKNGYDHGATNFATSLVQAAHKNGWYAVTRTDTRPAGIGEDGVRFNNAVYVITIDYTAPMP